MEPKDSQEKDKNSPPLHRPSFLDFEGGTGGGFELSRSMSAPPAEFLTSIQSVRSGQGF